MTAVDSKAERHGGVRLQFGRTAARDLAFGSALNNALGFARGFTWTANPQLMRGILRIAS